MAGRSWSALPRPPSQRRRAEKLWLHQLREIGCLWLALGPLEAVLGLVVGHDKVNGWSAFLFAVVSALLGAALIGYTIGKEVSGNGDPDDAGPLLRRIGRARGERVGAVPGQEVLDEEVPRQPAGPGRDPQA